jgi:hypothetical protein
MRDRSDNNNKISALTFCKEYFMGYGKRYLFVNIPGKNNKIRISAIQIEIAGNFNKRRKFSNLLFVFFYLCFKS